MGHQEPGEHERDSGDAQLMDMRRVRPKQSAPPRTTSMSSGGSSGGRFIANGEAMLRNEVAAGRKTLLGQALELPQVQRIAGHGMQQSM